VAGVAARLLRGVDLREHGGGTVSGSGLGEVAGIGPMVVAGALDVAKGTVGPLLAGDRSGLAALAVAVTIAGHNWSPYLRGAGGRGIAPALGGLIVTAPEGAALLLGGVAVGRVVDQAGLGTFGGAVALGAVLRRRGKGALAAAVLVPMAAKRLAGNRPAPSRASYVTRLLLDRDPLP
jgi:glycerol-3-phosphate acyltransferase PlsY